MCKLLKTDLQILADTGSIDDGAGGEMLRAERLSPWRELFSNLVRQLLFVDLRFFLMDLLLQLDLRNICVFQQSIEGRQI